VLGKGFDRFYPANETCPITPYSNFIDGFFSKCKDTYFFINVFQFALVALMYWNVGKGRYWKLIFLGSFAGLIGGLLETGTIAYICRESTKKTPYTRIITLFIAEFFWITNEYSVPFLNLIKMKAFARGKSAKIVNYLVLGIFPLFAFCRFWIGYVRSRDGVLKNNDIDVSHGFAFGCMAIADLICTISIIYFVRKHNNQEHLKANVITHYIEHSSYTILVCVDIVSIILAISCFLTTYTNVPKSTSIPLHCLKCAFLLILATDALLFKYEAHTSSLENIGTTNKYATDAYNFTGASKSRRRNSGDMGNQYTGQLSNHSHKKFNQMTSAPNHHSYYDGGLYSTKGKKHSKSVVSAPIYDACEPENYRNFGY